MFIHILAFSIFISSVFIGYGTNRSDSPEVSTGIVGFEASKSLQPLLQYVNRRGVVSFFGKRGELAIVGGNYRYVSNENIGLSADVVAVANCF